MTPAGEHQFRMLIGGALVDGPRSFNVLNPATEEVLARCPAADRATIDAAAAAAKSAFPGWAATPWESRALVLHELADSLMERSSDFAQLLTEEQGKPLRESEMEIAGAAYTFKAIAAMTIPPRVLREGGGGRIEEHYLPLGVVAAITPWNFPVIQLASKLAPALLTGNTVVLKPAATTPLTALLFGELCARALPAGVVNIICDDNDLGDYLTSHPNVAKISFTGSTPTGRKVMASAASTLKRITLELGGNDAAIVLDDVDADVIAQRLFDGAMVNAGQICVAIKRAFVPRKLYEEVCEGLARRAREAVVGDGLEPETTIGPVQNKRQYEKLKALLASSQEQGTVIAGGEVLDRTGYFIRPTIVRDLPDDAPLVREEQFGPILPVLAYDEIDEAIARANNSDMGLCASVWGRDLDRAENVALRIEAGTVWVNQVLALDPVIPFRGAKQSGLGGEYGIDGLIAFTQPRVINRVELP